nr:hypothetical protein [Thermoproteota archaeon]
YSCFALVEHLISLSGVLTRCPRMGSGPTDDTLRAKVFCWQKKRYLQRFVGSLSHPLTGYTESR